MNQTNRKVGIFFILLILTFAFFVVGCVELRLYNGPVQRPGNPCPATAMDITGSLNATDITIPENKPDEKKPDEKFRPRPDNAI